MQYVSGIHALNIECGLNTCGDWHVSALKWKDITVLDSEGSILGDWGIEKDKKIPEHDGTFNVANDLRAIIDLMLIGNTGYLKGFREDFICTDEYNEEFFNKVYMLRGVKNWHDIDMLMQREFMWDWDKFKGENKNE